MNTTQEKPKSKAQIAREEKAEAIASLKEWLPKGSTVYTILRHVSDSGMTRHISLVAFQEGHKFPIHPNYSAAKALGWKLINSHGSDALVVGGCGMDMGFHLVYTLSSVLYGRDEKGNYSEAGCRSLRHEWL